MNTFKKECLIATAKQIVDYYENSSGGIMDDDFYSVLEILNDHLSFLFSHLEGIDYEYDFDEGTD